MQHLAVQCNTAASGCAVLCWLHAVRHVDADSFVSIPSRDRFLPVCLSFATDHGSDAASLTLIPPPPQSPHQHPALPPIPQALHTSQAARQQQHQHREAQLQAEITLLSQQAASGQAQIQANVSLTTGLQLAQEERDTALVELAQVQASQQQLAAATAGLEAELAGLRAGRAEVEAGLVGQEAALQAEVQSLRQKVGELEADVELLEQEGEAGQKMCEGFQKQLSEQQATNDRYSAQVRQQGGQVQGTHASAGTWCKCVKLTATCQ